MLGIISTATINNVEKAFNNFCQNQSSKTIKQILKEESTSTIIESYIILSSPIWKEIYDKTYNLDCFYHEASSAYSEEQLDLYRTLQAPKNASKSELLKCYILQTKHK